ncbi:hypothetical protein BTVI_136857 [Pitangus sulphuratus]|nr:hypothetical protein BTVI_136857 [Pitangus sulphuratus]
MKLASPSVGDETWATVRRDFFQIYSWQMQYRNIIGPLQDEDGHFTNRDIGKANVFNAFFAFVFNTDDRSKGSQCIELEDHDCENDQLPADPVVLWDLLLQLDPYKSMGPDEIYPTILKELADVISKPLSMIFEWSWESREVSVDWKLANVVLIFKKGKKEEPGNYRPDSLTSVPGKNVEKIILGSIEKHLECNTVISYSQHGFMRRKS